MKLGKYVHVVHLYTAIKSWKGIIKSSGIFLNTAPISEKPLRAVSKKKYKSGAVVVSDEEEVEVSSPAPKFETSVSEKKLKSSVVVVSDEEKVKVQSL